MQERLDKRKSMVGSASSNTLIRQTSERLLDRAEQAVRYHVNKERSNYRKNLLHFTRMEELPGLLGRLLGK